MVVFIIIVVILFAVFVVSLNMDKIRKKLDSGKTKQPKVKEEKPKKDKYEDSMTYSEYQPVKVDNLNDKIDNAEVVVESFVKLNEDEEQELEKKSKNKGGRLKGDVKSATIERVEVEDLGEYDENAESEVDFNEYLEDLDDVTELEDDDFFSEEDEFFLERKDTRPAISQEIQNLSPELKALLIDNVLSKREDKK